MTPFNLEANSPTQKLRSGFFLGSNKKSLPSWSEAFPQVSAKSLIGKQLSVHQPDMRLEPNNGLV
jgi:hypothetical protein